MKNVLLALSALFVTFQIEAQSIFINEIHYDNVGIDTGEGFEIVGPYNSNLAGYTVVLYNGTNGEVYSTINLTGTFPNQQNNRGALWFGLPENGLQNGAPDGLALVDDLGAVIQFLSYEGAFAAVDGPASGMTSTDIGVTEGSSTPVGHSLQLVGEGSDYSNFTWVGPLPGSPGTLNANQTLSVVKNEIAGFALYPNPVVSGKFTITTLQNIEKSAEIYALNGTLVYKNNVQSNDILDIANLNKGIYIVKIKEAGKIATRKLIVE